MKIRNLALLPLLAAPMLPFAPVAPARADLVAQARETSSVQVVPDTNETLYFNPDETYDLAVVVDSPATVNGLRFPAGTVIHGRLEPVEGGLRYVSTHVETGGFRNSLQAESDVLHDVKDPRETSVGSIAVDTAIGAAGGAALGAILGNGVSLGEVLGGAAAGAAVGNITAQRVVVLQPGEVIPLEVQ